MFTDWTKGSDQRPPAIQAVGEGEEGRPEGGAGTTCKEVCHHLQNQCNFNLIESFSEYLINRLVSLLQQAEDEDAKLEAELNELMNDSSIQQFNKTVLRRDSRTTFFIFTSSFMLLVLKHQSI